MADADHTDSEDDDLHDARSHVSCVDSGDDDREDPGDAELTCKLHYEDFEVADISALGWMGMPPLLLEDIFQHLSLRQRYACSQVCRSWYLTFRSPHIWKDLVFNEDTFTYQRYNLYRGHQKMISHNRVQLYLARLGRLIRNIYILPTPEFYNLYEFVKVLVTFLRFFDTYPMPLLKRFEFSFACETRTDGETMIFGTGGQMLAELKLLLASFRGLESLKLNDLLLDENDAPGLLNQFVDKCGGSLKHLEILNACKVYFPHFYVGMLPNLTELVISPSQLSDDIVIMLGNHSKLAKMVIVQDKYTCVCDPVSKQAWQDLRTNHPLLQVWLEVRGFTETDILIQPNAPVHSIIYNSPYARISGSTVLQIIDNYKRTLRTYGHYGLPRKFGSKSFHDRADTYLVMLAKSCPRLETLIIRERISTTTLLIMVSQAHNLRNLLVRQNALIKRFDWARAPQWTERYYNWLRNTAKSELLVEEEVSTLLGTQWKMLSDKWFKSLTSV